jgi:hypothetical protein
LLRGDDRHRAEEKRTSDDQGTDGLHGGPPPGTGTEGRGDAPFPR